MYCKSIPALFRALGERLPVHHSRIALPSVGQLRLVVPFSEHSTSHNYVLEPTSVL